MSTQILHRFAQKKRNIRRATFRNSVWQAIASVLFIAFLAVMIGCEPADEAADSSIDNHSPATVVENSANQQSNANNDQTVPQDPRSSFRRDANGNEQIAIGTFNIQSLGRTKISKPEVAKVLVDVIRRFDVIAIQELRDINQSTIPELMEMVNSTGLNFRAIVGPRQGYIVNTGRAYAEQGVFIYDANTIEPIANTYVADDLNRVMHRSPLVAQFRCRTNGPYNPFTFTLLNVHVDPDEIATELPAMVNIVRGTFANHNEDDFIVLGDLNATPEKISLYPWLENQIPLISSRLKTNTALTRTIDNIVLDPVRTSEFANQAGVMNLHDQYSLSRDEAMKVSDHMPVWAMFSAYENKPTASPPSPNNLPLPGMNGTLERTTRLPNQSNPPANPQPNDTAR